MSPASWGPVDANISILFTELPMLDRPGAAREAGFTAIEAWWPFGSAVPGDAEVDGFERAVRDAGVQLVSLNGFAGDMAGGERGIASWPGRRSEFLDNLDVVMGLGDRLGCRRFNMLYGNRVDGADAPGRHEPGTGTADLDGWVRQLRELGYDGWIGLEYAPLEDTVTGLRRMGLDGGTPAATQSA